MSRAVTGGRIVNANALGDSDVVCACLALSRFTIATVLAATLSIGTAHAAGALNNLVETVTDRGETCKRIGSTMAYCSLFKRDDYNSLLVAMPDYNRNLLKTGMDRLRATAAAERETVQRSPPKTILSTEARPSRFAARVLGDGDVVVVNCAFHKTGK